MAAKIASSYQGYLPFAAAANFKADYLRLLVQQGGATVDAYKTMSFSLLELEPGLRVLDVGCGVGVDLQRLAGLVGPQGEVVGLDHDPDLVREAQNAIAADEHTNVRVIQADAEQMPFASAQYDRVRADRVIQHIRQPERAIAEMWRVLRPGGILTLVEPDWRTMALYPASPAGGDDDGTFSRVLEFFQKRLPHALIGRQLHALLHRQQDSWEQVEVQAVSFSLTSWPMIDTILQISTAARALAQRDPKHMDEVEAWLSAVEIAASKGEFFTSVPLFFAYARKIGDRGK